jgi:hypothetical protein
MLLASVNSTKLQTHVTLDTSLQSIFFDFLSGELTVGEFARWVYENSVQLEKTLPEPFYVDLIAFDYKSKTAGINLKKILEQHLQPDYYENWRISHLLNQLKSVGSQENLFDMLHKIYEESYGLGSYDFLKRIGIQYVVLADLIPAFRYDEYPRWNDGSYKIEEDLLKHHLKYIRQEAQKITVALKEDKIQLTGDGTYSIEPRLEKELLNKDNWNIVPPFAKPDTKEVQPGKFSGKKG